MKRWQKKAILKFILVIVCVNIVVIHGDYLQWVIPGDESLFLGVSRHYKAVLYRVSMSIELSSLSAL